MSHVSVGRIKIITMGIGVEHSKLLTQYASSLARFKTTFLMGLANLSSNS